MRLPLETPSYKFTLAPSISHSTVVLYVKKRGHMIPNSLKKAYFGNNAKTEPNKIGKRNACNSLLTMKVVPLFNRMYQFSLADIWDSVPSTHYLVQTNVVVQFQESK